MNTSNQKMRAAQIHSFGGLAHLEIQNIEIPTPGEGEVLVKVHAAAVNPVDWKIREGYLAEIIPHQLPLTLGWDFAGEIVSVGKSVNSWSIGEAVYARPDLAKNGAFAEYILVSEKEIAAKPKSLNWQKSAAVPLVTLTAWQSLKDIGNIKQGDRVLIHAGAGGVGIAAIQLAKLAGATVYTTASTRNIEFLKTLGADHIIDYTQQDFSDLSNLDMVFDTLGGDVLQKSWATLKQGGCLVSIAEVPNDEIATQHQVNAHFCFVQANPDQLAEIAKLIDSELLKIEIDSVFKLEDLAKAQQKSETGHVRGKIVIQVEEE
ncbi:NADP-dependent oxidoreductase [Catenovulum sediminis]|uniref:NADP-dependent oxidoreductase n=1 Tax=Catenovulum sediminis TaxID=1740262 RepID=UPI001180C917|nr:NADP-dependent oxidoreductase [Catenovulum sediminis]